MTRGRPNPLCWRFAERLRARRKAAGLTPSTLSLAAGLSKNTGALLEGADGSPRVDTVDRVARVLGASPGWLAYGLGSPDAPGEQGPLRCAGLPQRLQDARGELSLREVGRRAGAGEGVPATIMRGTMPALNTLEQLAVALGVSPAWLAFGEGPRELPRRRAKTAPAAAANP